MGTGLEIAMSSDAPPVGAGAVAVVIVASLDMVRISLGARQQYA